jgi:integrase
MDFTHLQQHYHELLDHLGKEGFTEGYIQRVRENIQWIFKNDCRHSWQSYLDAYHERVCKTESKLYKKNLKTVFGAIQRFDLHGKCPDRKTGGYLVRRAAYDQLVPEYKEIMKYYRGSIEPGELKESTIKGNTSNASCFFLAMQKRGIENLRNISEGDVLSFFCDSDGNLNKCSSYKKGVAAVLKVAAGWKEQECNALLAYLPHIRPKRKNVQFLTPDEAQSIRMVIGEEESGLSLLDKAIGKLLFFTGMRACDIAGMRLDSIDWGAEELSISQQKTDEPLILPLTAAIGNSIYDYLVHERPTSDDSRLFLSSVYPFYPLEPGSIWHHASNIYREAGIRQEEGDRRGTHLFRHNAATSFLGNGVPRQVISRALGHADPGSLDPYLHADFVHLKECALSIEAFPVGEEVFCL